METRLKERLTGAAILVALIVLVVPELFHGQRPEVAATTSSSGEGPPVRSYTIDLSNGAARTAPLQSTDTGGEVAAGTPAANSGAAGTPGTALAAAPPAAGTGPQATGPPATVPPVTMAPVTTPAATNGSGASATPAPKTKPPPAAPAAALTHAAAKTASAASWSVRLGLFTSRENAERLMHAAQGRGFPVSVSDVDGKGLYHVVAAGLADRAAAQTLQGRLQAQGFQAALVAPPSGSPRISR